MISDFECILSKHSSCTLLYLKCILHIFFYFMAEEIIVCHYKKNPIKHPWNQLSSIPLATFQSCQQGLEYTESLAES